MEFQPGNHEILPQACPSVAGKGTLRRTHRAVRPLNRDGLESQRAQIVSLVPQAQKLLLSDQQAACAPGPVWTTAQPICWLTLVEELLRHQRHQSSEPITHVGISTHQALYYTHPYINSLNSLSNPMRLSAFISPILQMNKLWHK